MTEDSYDGCGISKIWATDENDPFYYSCKLHDRLYTGTKYAKVTTRKFADQTFLRDMLHIAGNNLGLKAKAYIYYAIARSFGWAYWG